MNVFLFSLSSLYRALLGTIVIAGFKELSSTIKPYEDKDAQILEQLSVISMFGLFYLGDFNIHNRETEILEIIIQVIVLLAHFLFILKLISFIFTERYLKCKKSIKEKFFKKSAAEFSMDSIKIEAHTDRDNINYEP